MVVLAGHRSLNLLRLMCKRHHEDLPGSIEIQEATYVFIWRVVAGIEECVHDRDMDSTQTSNGYESVPFHVGYN